VANDQAVGKSAVSQDGIPRDSAAKPQPKERGSVSRSAVQAKRATGVFKDEAAGRAAGGHRPALRKIFAAREDGY